MLRRVEETPQRPARRRAAKACCFFFQQQAEKFLPSALRRAAPFWTLKKFFEELRRLALCFYFLSTS